MAKPTNSVRGFIEVTLDEEAMLIALDNIICVKSQGEHAVLVLKTPLDSYNRKQEFIHESYEIVIKLMKEAAQ